MSETIPKARRQHLVAELIRKAPVASQEELVERLSEAGLSVTQATISRDLAELRAFKARRREGLCYALPGEANEPAIGASRLSRVLVEWAESIEVAGKVVVIKTPPGSAHVVGNAIDRARWPEIAGTIAGDDTLLVVVRDGHSARGVEARIARASQPPRERRA